MKKTIILICEICNSRNYHFKNQTNATTRLEIKKYCSKCNQHTMHKQTR